MKTLIGLTAALVVAVLLAACGGGGGGGGNNAPADGAALADIELSAGALDQVFQSGQFDYTSTVGYLATTTTVTPTTVDAAATVTVNGVAVSSGSASDPLPLDVGMNAPISIVVTAADGLTTDTYTVTVTRESANQFAQRAYIKASNTGEGDQFGYSVALSGNTLAVGAPGEASDATGIDGDQSNTSQPNAGAVYVFTRNGTTWTQQAYIKASNTDGGDNFGFSVALSGDTLAVGATGEASSAKIINGDQNDTNAPSAGAVYVFTRSDGMWSQQAYVKASNTAQDYQFGYSVALSGDTLAVGSTGEASDGSSESNTSTPNAGAAYVFTRSSGPPVMWIQQAYIKASNPPPASDDNFGWSLTLLNDTLVVGAPGQDSNTGAGYLFTRISGTWNPMASFTAAIPRSNDGFGWSLALTDDMLAVGAPGEDSGATGIDGNQNDTSMVNAGAVYTFQ